MPFAKRGAFAAVSCAVLMLSVTGPFWPAVRSCVAAETSVALIVFVVQLVERNTSIRLAPAVFETLTVTFNWPFAELRFDSDEDLVGCAVRAAEMPRTEKRALVEALQVHCRRGTGERFRTEMLRPLRDLLRERGMLPKD